jgi:hypothetical protein
VGLNTKRIAKDCIALITLAEQRREFGTMAIMHFLTAMVVTKSLAATLITFIGTT